jgi:hypothetical protein
MRGDAVIYDDLIHNLESQRQRDDEMSIETERLLQTAANAIDSMRATCDNQQTEIADLRDRLASARKVLEEAQDALSIEGEYRGVHVRVADAEKIIKSALTSAYRKEE